MQDVPWGSQEGGSLLVSLGDPTYFCQSLSRTKRNGSVAKTESASGNEGPASLHEASHATFMFSGVSEICRSARLCFSLQQNRHLPRFPCCHRPCPGLFMISVSFAMMDAKPRLKGANSRKELKELCQWSFPLQTTNPPVVDNSPVWL
eukprot:1160291-Pelagomonas_calceolata.AAC.16